MITHPIALGIAVFFALVAIAADKPTSRRHGWYRLLFIVISSVASIIAVS